MRRRDLLAGLGSLGVLGSAAAVHFGSGPFESSEGEEPAHDPVEVTSIDAPGSEAGSLTLPSPGRVTFVDLFATTCTVCQDQMPALGVAAETVGEDVTFVSLTAESETIASDERIRGWWEEYDGHWTVARDESFDFVRHYSRATPTAVLFDADGMLRWEETGRKTADEIIDHIDGVRES